MARQTWLAGMGDYLNRGGAPGNRANRLGFGDDEDESTLITDRTTPFTDYLIKNRQPPSTRDYFAPTGTYLSGSLGGSSSLSDVIAGGQRGSMADFDLTLGTGTGRRATDFIGPPAMDSMADFDWTLGGGTGPESPSDVSTPAPSGAVAAPPAALDLSSLNLPDPMDSLARESHFDDLGYSPGAFEDTEEVLVEEAQGPRSFLDKLGGGVKGVITTPGVGDALIATGTRVMSEGFGGLGEGIREGASMIDVGQQKQKYTDTIEQVGFGMPEEEKAIMRSMPPAQGMEYMMNWRDSERGRKARSTGLMNVLNIPPEMAATMAWSPEMVDRVLSRPNELHTVTDGKDQVWVVDLSAGIDPEDRVAGGPIGAAKVDLTGYQLAQQQRVIEQNNLSHLFERVRAQYGANNDKVQGLAQLKAGTEFLSETDADGNYIHEGRFGEFNEIRSKWDKLTGAEMAADRDTMNQMLLKLGIGNLGDFKGAISEMELAKALEAAGDFSYLRESLIRLLNTEQTKVAGIMESHQKDVDTLRSVPGGSDLMLDRWELKTDPEYEQRIKDEMFDNPSMTLPEGSTPVSNTTWQEATMSNLGMP